MRLHRLMYRFENTNGVCVFICKCYFPKRKTAESLMMRCSYACVHIQLKLDVCFRGMSGRINRTHLPKVKAK